MSQLTAVFEGYQDKTFDDSLLAVQIGYWTGYYSQGKKAKSLKVILKKLVQARSKNSGKSREHEEVDVERFLQQEQAFLERKRVLDGSEH